MGDAGQWSEHVAAADAARDARDWAAAAERYAAALAMRPEDAGIWEQLGHAHREDGRLASAREAYERALALDRHRAETHLFLGHTARAGGERDRAIAAYAQALRLRPDYADALRELIALGGRDHIPDPAARDARDPGRLAVPFGALLREVREWQASAGYSRGDWDRFCRDIPIRPPPGPLPGGPVTVLVDARGRSAAALRATIRSLGDQSVRNWRAVVTASPEQAAHPVAGLAADRVRFADEWPELAGPVAILDAGTVLHPEALAWMLFALTHADAAFCDQDEAVRRPLAGWERRRPRLFGVYDPDFTCADGPPALVVAARMPAGAADGEAARAAILAGGRAAHVPRALASVAERAVAAVRTPAAPPRTDVGLGVVIPTRDRPDLLDRAIQSLRAKANAPERLAIVVVDGGGSAVADGATVLPVPGPFNWSRGNRLGAAAVAAELLLFLNDDVEMLSRGWDDALVAALAEPDVGAVGARLLYPDTSVQHVGLVFGEDRGWVAHEGRGAPFDDPGPDRRWVSRRSVAAVTGAFLGTTRDWLERTGGFDEALAVAYNDLDYCLRVRAAGGRVLFEPAIEAIHHEGATRGRDLDEAAWAWDAGERDDLIARWGDGLADDPGLSPYWLRDGPPLNGLREPPMHAIVAHIERSAWGNPWHPRASDDP